jgi:hypothetical protein
LKIPIINIPPNNLMEFLKEHIRVKKKYYAISKYVMNDFKDPNKIMQRILDKHKLYFLTLVGLQEWGEIYQIMKDIR